METDILNSINTEETWIDVETLANLKNVTNKAVLISINNCIYQTENARGGKAYKIKLSSIEKELQIKYIQDYYNEINAAENEIIELNNLEIKQEKLISEEQKKLALAKYDLIMNWQEFKKKFIKDRKQNKTDPRYKNVRADVPFIELYNTGKLYEDIFNTVGKVSAGSLFRWQSLLGYNGDWT